MPHPKNRLKLTGDTHLPDVTDLMAEADEIEIVAVEIVEAEPRVYADGYVPSPDPASSSEQPRAAAEPQRTGALAAVERRVEALPKRSPWLAVGAGLMFGWLVARLLSR